MNRSSASPINDPKIEEVAMSATGTPCRRSASNRFQTSRRTLPVRARAVPTLRLARGPWEFFPRRVDREVDLPASESAPAENISQRRRRGLGFVWHVHLREPIVV